MRARVRWGRHAAAGAAFGTALALCLHAWQLYATNYAEMAPEGTTFITYALALLLGFPTNLLLSAFVDLAGGREYYLLLLGIVMNGALIGVARGLLRRRD